MSFPKTAVLQNGLLLPTASSEEENHKQSTSMTLLGSEF